jgi:hypothetical protein
MVQEDHFQEIFSLAFSDPGYATSLVEKARKLRAASHHPGEKFTTGDLRDLRVTWNAIRKSLCALEAGIAVVWE